jgi:hypothetical protein
MSFGDTAWTESENNYEGYHTLSQSPGTRLTTEWQAGAQRTAEQIGGPLGKGFQWLEQNLPQNMEVPDPSGVQGLTGNMGTVGDVNRGDPWRTADEANAQSMPGYGQRYSAPTRQSTIDWDNYVAGQKRWRAEVLSRSDSLGPLDLGAQLAGAMTDPGNVLLAMSGAGEALGDLAFGESATTGAAAGADAAGGIARYGKLWNGIPESMGRSLLAQAPFTIKDLSLDYASGRPDDFDMGQELAQIAGFAVLHGAVHLGSKALGEYMGGERPAPPGRPAAPGEGAPTPAAAAPAGEAPGAAAAPFEAEAAATGAPSPSAFEESLARIQAIGQKYAEPESAVEARAQAAKASYSVDGAARAADPDAVDAYRSGETRRQFWRDQVQREADARASSPEAQALGEEISDLETRTGKRAAAVRDRLADLKDQLNTVLTSESPRMTEARQGVQAADRVMMDNAERYSAAYRQARMGEPVDRRSNPTGAPGGIDKPAVVKQLAPSEATATFVSTVDSLRQGEDADPATMIGHALDPNAPGAELRAALVAGQTGEGIAPEEQALRDSALMDSETVDGATEQAFLKNAAPDHPGLTDESGSTTDLGRGRIELAMLAKAFPDRELLDTLLDHTDPVLRGLGQALRTVAASVAALNASIEEGRTPMAYGISDAIVEAANLVKAARETGTRIVDLVRDVTDDPDDLFTGNGAIGQTTEAMLRVFFHDEDFRRPTAAGKVAATLDYYARAAMEMEAPDGPDAAGDAATAGLRVAYQKNLLGWDLRAGIQRAPGRAEGAGSEAGVAGRGGVEHGLSGGEPADRGVSAQGGEGPGGRGQRAPGDGGLADGERADDTGPGAAEPAVSGEPRREPGAGSGAAAEGAVRPQTFQRLLAEDDDLKQAQEVMQRIEAQTGKPVEFDPKQDPNVLAEAFRAAEVCMLGEG